jgi:hypothetical protein
MTKSRAGMWPKITREDCLHDYSDRILQGDTDRHKGRWFLLLGTIVLILVGIAFVTYAKRHQPIQPATYPGHKA